ncbi:MAG: hypothetical protein ACPGSB_02595 [Opitutales bacterium]
MSLPRNFTCFLALQVVIISSLHAAPFGLDFLSRKAERVEEKRVEKTTWEKPINSSLLNKSFPITNWNKHFSRLGSKRAPISMSEGREKKRFEKKMIERKTIDFEMSRLNQRMIDLHKRAGIDMDQRAQLVADRQLYDMMLQDAKNYREMAEKVSLRDLNIFQFRRNRTADGIPVQKAGEGE